MYSTRRVEYLCKIWDRYIVSWTREAFLHLIYGFIYLKFVYLCASLYGSVHMYSTCRLKCQIWYWYLVSCTIGLLTFNFRLYSLIICLFMRVPLQLLAHVFYSSTKAPENLRSISRFLYQRGLLTFNLRLYLLIICLFMRVPLRLLAPVFCTSTRVLLRNVGSISRSCSR